MTGTVASVVGGATGASARGAAHIARGKPNQDSAGWRQMRLWTSIAVADGHGSAPHYRSDRGSRFAVEALLTLFDQVTRGGTLREPDVLARAVPDLPGRLVSLWRAAVEADVASDPILEASGFPSHTVYGSTCLGASIGPGIALLIQIGDGTLFAGLPAGDVVSPFEADDLEGEQTYSLCLPDAEQQVKAALFVAPSPLCAPDFVLAATDGFEKSFSDTRDALDVVRHYRRAVAERGLDAVATELGPWLSQCSAMGSGDDTTVAIFAAEPGPHDGAPPADAPARVAAPQVAARGDGAMSDRTSGSPPGPARRGRSAMGLAVSRVPPAVMLGVVALGALVGGMTIERWRRPLVSWMIGSPVPAPPVPAPAQPPRAPDAQGRAAPASSAPERPQPRAAP